MSSINSFLEDLTPGKAVVLIVGGLVMAVIWFLNVIFTFSYGYDVVGPFLLLDQMGTNGSAILTGVVAVLFFDISYTVGFMTLLFGCSSIWQYAVTSLQFSATFVLSIIASVVSIVMLSPLGGYVPANAVEAIRYLGYGALIVGFVINAVATIGYIVTMPAMAEGIRKTVKAASQLQTNIRRQSHLDKQSREIADNSISQYIPFVAEIKADEGLLAYLKELGYENPDDVMRMVKRMRNKKQIDAMRNDDSLEPQSQIMAADGSPSPRLDQRSPNAPRPVLSRAEQIILDRTPQTPQSADPVISLMVELMGEETTKRVLDQIMPK